MLAICPATEPTAPAAPDTTTLSNGLIAQTSCNPKYAVRPVKPSAPKAVDTGAAVLSSLRQPDPFETTCSCHPVCPTTMSPAEKPVFFDSTTSATPPPTISPPISTGGA